MNTMLDVYYIFGCKVNYIQINILHIILCVGKKKLPPLLLDLEIHASYFIEIIIMNK
jgi:hypothetical protein